MAMLFKSYADGCAIESIALKAAMTVPDLLLQKPCKTSKARDHIVHLEWCLTLLKKGKFDELDQERRSIQRVFDQNSKSSTSTEQDTVAHSFNKLMEESKVKAALRRVSNHQKGSLLSLDSYVQNRDSTSETVKQVLQNKHPPPKPIIQSGIRSPKSSPQGTHSITYDS